MNGGLLAIDALGVTIAAATAATFAGIVGVALFQAWLNRAWLDVRPGGLVVVQEWQSHPPSVLADFRVTVFNRSRRPNSIVGILLEITRPSVCAAAFPTDTSSDDDRAITIRADGNSGLPIPMHIPEILVITVRLRLWENDDWLGQAFEGQLTVVDMHQKHRSVRIGHRLPGLEREDAP